MTEAFGITVPGFEADVAENKERTRISTWHTVLHGNKLDIAGKWLNHSNEKQLGKEFDPSITERTRTR